MGSSHEVVGVKPGWSQTRFWDAAESNGNGKPHKTRKVKAAPEASLDALQRVVAAAIGPLEKRLEAVEARLAVLVDGMNASRAPKEYYTTQEVARLLGKRPYTVREWCRLGRVQGEKSHSGRGLDEEWRISHAELLRIQNEGLLPLRDSLVIAAPRRLK